ncbi:hypothetical protein CJ030_MR6G024202 [Morella rubra]|uniref:Uncharacterized protein n=1 Tax=Morella rubra TaxID=262757 RepID=A0A6A1VC90_9ROSI|nr:hypothetical protein CJ030_MR6G024202 [Morella rubra]
MSLIPSPTPSAPSLRVNEGMSQGTPACPSSCASTLASKRGRGRTRGVSLEKSLGSEKLSVHIPEGECGRVSSTAATRASQVTCRTGQPEPKPDRFLPKSVPFLIQGLPVRFRVTYMENWSWTGFKKKRALMNLKHLTPAPPRGTPLVLRAPPPPQNARLALKKKTLRITHSPPTLLSPAPPSFLFSKNLISPPHCRLPLLPHSLPLPLAFLPSPSPPPCVPPSSSLPSTSRLQRAAFSLPPPLYNVCYEIVSFEVVFKDHFNLDYTRQEDVRTVVEIMMTAHRTHRNRMHAKIKKAGNINPAELYKKNYTNKDGIWTSEGAREIYERMDAFQRQCDLEGKTYIEIEVYFEILGKKSRYVWGLGRVAKPLPSSTLTTQSSDLQHQLAKARDEIEVMRAAREKDLQEFAKKQVRWRPR